jgi:ABC-2 type transport system ATP-binding protein
MIEVEHLSKDFGRTHAVRDVSFRVGEGEVLGLLGPNGSGKTTIMRILTGFFPPTSGRARVAGIDVGRDSITAREAIGYMPENVVLYPDMRVEQFLDFCADVRGLRNSRRRERVEAVVAECGLAEVRQRLVGKLSKGYRQRVGLAQALLHAPRVLILDEPTVGLDPRQIIEIRNLIRSLRGRTTILLSTHILPEVATTCERVLILDRGRVVAEDTAEALAHGVEGGERTLVRVAGPRETVVEALAGVEGVDRVELEDAAADGAVRLVAYSRAGDPVRKAIARAVVQKGWGLLEMKPISPTLEDLFVRLVNGQEKKSNHPE